MVRMGPTICWVAAVPKRVDKAFRNWEHEHVPYNLLTRWALEKPDAGKDASIVGQNGTFQPAPLDWSEEAAVEIGDWHGVSKLAEELVQTHWGDYWRTRLASDNLAPTVMAALEEVERRTGFKAMVFLGGLAPNTGKIASHM